MADVISTSEVEDIFNIPKVNRDIQEDSEDDFVIDEKVEKSVPFNKKVAEVGEAITKAATEPVDAEVFEKSVQPKQEKKKMSNSGMFDGLFDEKPAEKPAEKPVEKQEVIDPAKAQADLESQMKAIYVPAASHEVVVVTATPAPHPVVKATPIAKAPEMPMPTPTTPSIDFEKYPEPQAIGKEEDFQAKNPPKTTTKKKVEKVEKLDIEEEESDDSLVPFMNEISTEEGWQLKSPAPKYNRFYAEKAIALGQGGKSILPGGLVDFEARFNELSELSCDITVQTNDLEAIHQKMQNVQNLRERCKQIQVHTTQQYYLWERYIELFHGILCRIEYARGKQDGINFEHMSDMEHYFLSLKSLHRAADQVMRTLDGAFECLSRQVTIALPMKDIERHGSAVPAPRQITPEQKKYDALGATPSSSKPAVKSESGITPWI